MSPSRFDAKGFGWKLVLYAALSTLVWFATIRVASASRPGLRGALATTAIVCVAGGLATFPIASRRRKKGRSALFEYGLSALCRTGAPLAIVSLAIRHCDPETSRVCAVATLIGYFATVPVLVWLTFPPEETARG
ncbi:MAG: hypothetical protein IJM30_05950 [Thermoguttaceae bacterium]|nr:hypothetical protein [Thermoguttaceae bacterium]